jgi:hypothetical protein
MKRPLALVSLSARRKQLKTKKKGSWAEPASALSGGKNEPWARNWTDETRTSCEPKSPSRKSSLKKAVAGAESNTKSTEENRGWALAPGAMEIGADRNAHPPQKKNRDPTEGETEAILKSKSRFEENKTGARKRLEREKQHRGR